MQYTYQLTSEGKAYSAQSPLLEALIERPKDAVELVSELDWPIETVREHLKHYIQNGCIQRVVGERQEEGLIGSGEAEVARIMAQTERDIASIL